MKEEDGRNEGGGEGERAGGGKARLCGESTNWSRKFRRTRSPRQVVIFFVFRPSHVIPSQVCDGGAEANENLVAGTARRRLPVRASAASRTLT